MSVYKAQEQAMLSQGARVASMNHKSSFIDSFATLNILNIPILTLPRFTSKVYLRAPLSFFCLDTRIRMDVECL